MPSDVRDRLRRRLWSELDRPKQPRRSHIRVPVVAATCVAAVLVAGSVVFAQNVSHAPDQMRAAMGVGSEPSPAEAQLDRCYAAALAVRAVPIRPQWKPVATSEVNGVTVTSARVAGKPLFCETTTTAVNVSDPDAVPANAGTTTTGVLFATANGTVAGVTDPRWRSFDLRVTVAPDNTVTAEPEVSDGLFVARLGVAVGPGVKVEAVHETAHTFGPIPPRLVRQENGS
ncbi:hypothetical protein AOZ06_36645 [Kibdelosporangium phytohabitans]|uniref:Uncharacterized protein n=2 Tax=Kibdelosporangium phytohabitans TaxID=860235 RepID=A0A0N9I0J3_9PSEU|nr:hypothetical protein AOZ06_36645 [Kibdelosporangium phytohabitans]